jgi:hypothetical protein
LKTEVKSRHQCNPAILYKCFPKKKKTLFSQKHLKLKIRIFGTLLKSILKKKSLLSKQTLVLPQPPKHAQNSFSFAIMYMFVFIRNEMLF